jgi:hypothetical protein
MCGIVCFVNMKVNLLSIGIPTFCHYISNYQ